MKSITGVIVLILALTMGSFNIVFAAPGGSALGTSVAPDAATPLAKACRDKKAGTDVILPDGKKTKCPPPAPGTPAGLAVSDPGEPSNTSVPQHTQHPGRP